MRLGVLFRYTCHNVCYDIAIAIVRKPHLYQKAEMLPLYCQKLANTSINTLLYELTIKRYSVFRVFEQLLHFSKIADWHSLRYLHQIVIIPHSISIIPNWPQPNPRFFLENILFFVMNEYLQYTDLSHYSNISYQIDLLCKNNRQLIIGWIYERIWS